MYKKATYMYQKITYGYQEPCQKVTSAAKSPTARLKRRFKDVINIDTTYLNDDDEPAASEPRPELTQNEQNNNRTRLLDTNINGRIKLYFEAVSRTFRVGRRSKE